MKQVLNTTQKSRALARPNGIETVRKAYYHAQPYATAGYTSLAFFGSNTTTAAGGLEDTNLTLANQLDAGNDFFIQSVSIHFYPGVLIARKALDPQTDAASFSDDVYNFYKKGWLELKVNGKPWIQEGNLIRFPPKHRFFGHAAFSDTTTAAAHASDKLAYLGVGGETYEVPNYPIRAGESFGLTLNWSAAVPTPSGADARVMVVLDGQLQRRAQ